VHPPQQPHITYEIHTDELPVHRALRAMPRDVIVPGASGIDDTCLQCVNDCQPGLWIVDGGSPYVRHVMRRKYSIACGGPRLGRPPLAFAARSDRPAAAAGTTASRRLIDVTDAQAAPDVAATVAISGNAHQQGALHERPLAAHSALPGALSRLREEWDCFGDHMSG